MMREQFRLLTFTIVSGLSLCAGVLHVSPALAADAMKCTKKPLVVEVSNNDTLSLYCGAGPLDTSKVVKVSEQKMVDSCLKLALFYNLNLMEYTFSVSENHCGLTPHLQQTETDGRKAIELILGSDKVTPEGPSPSPARVAMSMSSSDAEKFVKGIFGNYNTKSVESPPFTDKAWTNCAQKDGEICTFDSKSLVRYGVEGKYTYKILEAGSHKCWPSTFGDIDPAPNVVKKCSIVMVTFTIIP